MNWLEFIASLVSATAWPICLLVFFLLLKPEVPTLVNGLRRLKYRDLELEFEKTSKAIAEQTKEHIPAPDRPVTIAGQSGEDASRRLSYVSDFAPRSAIIEAWLLVESAAIDALRRSNAMTAKSSPGPMRLRDHLVKAGFLDPKQQAVFEQLRMLRNEAVHATDAEFSSTAVANYVDSALQMAIYLEERANTS
ncbi:hypothetical protein [Arenimonas sp.]|uniref:hypothetical protein n=1 Tax=Arenimonas sp. TaxID=1872635 RepID=UPI0035B0287E